MKSRIRMFLKNGVQLPDIVCEEFEVTRNVSTGEVVRYRFAGADGPHPMHINVREISAVYEMPVKEERPANRERCEYCRGTKYTPKPFKVITQTAAVRECVFNFCPVCGAPMENGGPYGDN